jgi:hypothetical protein
MSYTSRAYRDMGRVLAAEVEEINDSVFLPLEREAAMETVESIADRIAEVFAADNPHGFDKIRFRRDAGIPTD